MGVIDLRIGDYSIRPIEENDLKLLLLWRNSERIHSVMLTDHKITWDEHYNWFKKISEYNPKRNFIFEYKNEPIGYIGYTDNDEKNKICSPGAYLGNNTDIIPIDAAFYLFYFTVEYAFAVLNQKALITTVFKNNKRALKIDKILGYEITECNQIVKNNKIEEIYILKLQKKTWNIQKNKFTI